MEKISCTDVVKNEEVLRRVKEEKNILHTVRLTEVVTSKLVNVTYARGWRLRVINPAVPLDIMSLKVRLINKFWAENAKSR
jgi:hypothetical protein